MEKIPLLLKEANKLFKDSDHLVYMTYPLIRDNKLLVRIAEKLGQSLEKFMDVVLYYDRLYKRIGPYPENFEFRFDVFKTKCSKRYGFEEVHLKIIKELHDFIENRRKSEMEFVRNNKYFITGRDYDLRSVSIEQLKDYLNKSRIFIKKINSMFSF